MPGAVDRLDGAETFASTAHSIYGMRIRRFSPRAIGITALRS
jgi:hypothetical protein